MIALGSAPGVTSQRVDKSGFISSNGSSINALCGYSLKGPLTPVLLSSPDELDSLFGRPDPKVSYAHYGARHLLNKGFPVYFRRVVDSTARYGGAAVLANASVNSVTIDKYPAIGSPFAADPDPTDTIAPTGPGYIALTFNGPFVTLNTINLNIVLDSQAVAISPVTYAVSSDNTMTLLAAAIETALAAGGTGGKATVIDTDPTLTTNARTIGIFAPSGQSIAITGVTVTAGASQPTATQQTPLFYIQAENPGAHSSGIGVKFNNADIGTKEVIQLTFASSVGAVSSLTATINGVACAAVSNVTPSDAFLAAVAAAIEAHPDVHTATVTKKSLGEANDRVITIKMLYGSSTAANISLATTGGVPGVTVTQIVPGVSPTGAFDVLVYKRENPTIADEVHRCSIAEQTDNYGVQQQVAYVVNLGDTASTSIRVIANAATDGSVVIPFDPLTGDITSTITWLSAGVDGAIPSGATFGEAWKDFEDAEKYPSLNLVNTGYTSSIVQAAMKDVAIKRNDGSHAILDVPSNVQKFAALLNHRLTSMPLDTSFASAYFPDAQQQDPYTGMNIWVPCSAHIAADYCNNDAIRGVGGAPAGMQVGQIDTPKLRYLYKAEEYNQLFDKQLNPIRQIGSAFYIMGDATLQVANSALSFVSVARLVGFIEGRIRTRGLYYLFQKNNDTNAFAFVEEIKKFLAPYIANGDLRAARVVSTGANNPNGIIEQGNRIIDVILDPARTMRRILVRSTITAVGGIASIEVSEL